MRRPLLAFALTCLMVAGLGVGISNAQNSSGLTLSASFGGLVYSRSTSTFNSVLTLTNYGSAPVATPIEIAVSTGVSGVGIAGVTVGNACQAGNPGLIDVSTSGNVINAGQSVTFVVEFVDPQRIQFTPEVLSISAALQCPGVVGGASSPYLIWDQGSWNLKLWN